MLLDVRDGSKLQINSEFQPTSLYYGQFGTRTNVKVTPTNSKKKKLTKSKNRTSKVFQNYSNKWALTGKLLDFLCSKWGGQNFVSGYFVYPDDFNENNNIPGALAITHTSQNLVLNPRFDKITVHIQHWLSLALKNNRSYILKSPVRTSNPEWRFIVNLDIVTVVYLQQRVSFENIKQNYSRPGVCPSKTCYLFLNVRGENQLFPNDSDGIFSYTKTWYDSLQCQPLTNTSIPTWPRVKNIVKDYNKKEQKAIALCSSSYKFDDLIPSIKPSLDTSPFTPLSPLWNSSLSPLLTRFFSPHYTPRPRDKISISRAEYLLKTHKGKFRPSGVSCCSLCGSNSHPTQACVLRIPSVHDLGITDPDDLLMYKFLCANFPFWERIVAIPGENEATTARRIRDTVLRREKSFITSVNQFFKTQRPPITFRWTRPSFSQARNHLPHHVALGKPLWILMGVCFGIYYPWLQTPPFRTIGTPPIVTDDMFEIILKEIKRGTFFISPPDFPDNVHPLFGAVSSGKLRLLFHLRWLNGYMASFRYQQASVNDFMQHVRPQDVLWFEDMSSAFQQLQLCPNDKRRLGFQFIHNNRLFTCVADYALFGACANPFLLRERYKEEVRLCNMVNKATLLWVDDANGVINGDLPPEDIQTCMHFNKFIFENGGCIFGDKGVQWNPRRHITTLGWHIFAPLRLKMTPADKIVRLYETCDTLINSPSTSLFELSSIAGKMNTYGTPMARLHITELYNIMTKHLIAQTDSSFKTLNKGSHHPKGPEVDPTIHFLHHFNEHSKEVTLNEDTNYITPTSSNTKHQHHYQLKCSSSAHKFDCLLKYKHLKLLPHTPPSKKIYKMKFKTPPELGRIFSSWFANLQATTELISEKTYFAEWTTGFFVTADASEIGVGFHILFQKRNSPRDTQILISAHRPFPDELQSWLNSNSTSAIRSSAAREAYALYCAASKLTEITSKGSKTPIFFYTDSLALAFLFSQQRATCSLTFHYIKKTHLLLLRHKLHQYKLFWKQRTLPSAQSADTASRLAPLFLTPLSINLIKEFHPYTQNATRVKYFLKPVELLNLHESSVPPKMEYHHNIHNKKFMNIVIIPPNLPKDSYGKICRCLMKFNFFGLIITPNLIHTMWFAQLQKELGKHLILPFDQQHYNSTIFKKTKKFGFSSAVFLKIPK